MSPRVLSVLALVLGLFGCTPRGAWAAPAVFVPTKLVAMDQAVIDAIEAKKLPGGVLWLERDGTIYKKAYGRRAVLPNEEPMLEDTIFDAASLTKVLATTPAIMLLVERGKLKVDAPVAAYIPEFAQHGKEGIQVRHLLTHTAGLRSGLSGTPTWSGYAGAIESACQEKPQSEPGAMFLYSDLDFILLGEIVQRVTGERLNDFAAREIFRPLRMSDTGFFPAENERSRIAPTEASSDGAMLRGVVHDPTARKMGGLAGHAGLFTCAADVARFARMMLNGGTLEGVRVLSAASVQAMTTVQTRPEISRRGFGWDIDSAYSAPRGNIFPLGSYGHTGWTGTSLWIEPTSRTFVIFLSNRVHPDGKGDVTPLRRTLGTLAAEATGFDFTAARAAALPPRSSNEPALVLNGVDVLVREHFIRWRGMKLGLITNHTGHDRNRNPTIDLMFQAPDVKLVALFSPEHGIRGSTDAEVSDSRDAKTGLPIYSLYGNPPPHRSEETVAQYDRAVIEAREPTLDQLRDLDALVFDIQEIGSRFYTYGSTLGGAIEAAARAGKKIYVLDRVNPLGGTVVEGPVQTRHSSFIGFHPVPVRHGLTVGELARLINTERGFNADLTVVACEGWTRRQTFDETGLPWTNPSPSIKSFDAAVLYPGMCLLESTSVSMGRGTPHPFEQIGAPYIDDVRLARELNQAGLAGVHFIPVRFTPTAQEFSGAASILKYRDVTCGGVNLVITDRDKLRVVDVGITVALTLCRLYPKEFDVDRMAVLLGHEPTLQAIKAGKSLAEIKALWTEDLAAFETRRRAYLIYP